MVPVETTKVLCGHFLGTRGELGLAHECHEAGFSTFLKWDNTWSSNSIEETWHGIASICREDIDLRDASRENPKGVAGENTKVEPILYKSVTLQYNRNGVEVLIDFIGK